MPSLTLPAAVDTGTILSTTGKGLAAVGQIAGGLSQADNARSVARQLVVNGGQAVAAGQRRAIGAARQADYVLSKARAGAAASGAGATDPSVLNIEAGIAQQGEYNALSALYEGQDAQRSALAQASAARADATSYATAGLLRGTGTILEGASSLYDRYGKPPTKPTQISAPDNIPRYG